VGRISYIQEGEAYLLQRLPVDFEGFSSIAILVPFLRAIYFFFSRDVVQAQTDREIINSSGLAAAAAGGGGGGGFSFLASFLLIFYY